MTAKTLQQKLAAQADPDKAAFYPKFFRTGPGDYGEGDQFLGVTVPKIRQTIKAFRAIEFDEIQLLLDSPYHEVRMAGVLLMVDRYERENSSIKAKVFRFYLKNTSRINNWDLVDVSAHKIVGAHLAGKDLDQLYKLARSRNLWRRRIAMIATFWNIRQGDFEPTLAMAEELLGDSHDLIHKAVGWMLREMGKRQTKLLRNFLDTHASDMPRTMLRYAIEKLSPSVRAAYLKR